MALIAALIFLLDLLLFLAFCCIAAGAYAFFAWLVFRLREEKFKISVAALASPPIPANSFKTKAASWKPSRKSVIYFAICLTTFGRRHARLSTLRWNR
jgi:hypothetical protein